MSFGGVVQLLDGGEYVADANVYRITSIGQEFVMPTGPNGSFLVLGDYPEGAPFKVSKVGLRPLLFDAPAPGMAVGLYMQPVDALPDLEVYPDPVTPPAPSAGISAGQALGWGAFLWWLLTNLGDNGSRRR